MFIYLASLSLSILQSLIYHCPQLSVLLYLLFMYFYLCQHLSLSLCFCVVSITVTIIYLSNIYLYLICLLQSFSLPHSLSLRLSQPQYIYLTYPCDILFHGLFLSIYLFSGSLHFFSLFLCLILYNCISRWLHHLVCLFPSFLTLKTSVQKYHLQKTCTWDQVWLECMLSKHAYPTGYLASSPLWADSQGRPKTSAIRSCSVSITKFLASKLSFPKERQKTLDWQLFNNLALPSLVRSFTTFFVCCCLPEEINIPW